MTSVLASNESTEHNIMLEGRLAKKIIRTFCDLCGEVYKIKTYWEDGEITETNLEEHTGCSE